MAIPMAQRKTKKGYTNISQREERAAATNDRQEPQTDDHLPKA